jgi:CubicO group peptidase (beta-lactamase class C family)
MRLLALILLAATTASAQLATPPDNAFPEAKIEAIATKILHDTGVPSASIGVVQNGRIVYTGAFGLASLHPEKPAEPGMAYPIGSISKQFTSTAVLLLQQEGKLSIDDPVSKYFPELTRANEVTLRNLLTMTSGYQDFAPQDYIIPAERKPTQPLTTVHTWAKKPLDFTPGTDWQYSNTNYVLIALIVEKVTGEPFYQFLRERVLIPLDLPGVINTYAQRDKLRVTGYVSNALAPPREQPLEGDNWYFGDGELAMPASTLLKWDLSIINRTLLTPASYDLMETPFRLKDGRDSTYGLGIHITTRNSRLRIEHGGEVGGFVSENIVYPNEHAAIVVLTNEVASSAAAQIAAAIEPLLFAGAPSSTDTFAPQLTTILAALQSGKIDRSLFTPNANDYFSPTTLADFQSTLTALGAITVVTRTSTLLRGGMTFSFYRVTFSNATTLEVSVGLTPDNKIEQLLIVGKA